MSSPGSRGDTTAKEICFCHERICLGQRCDQIPDRSFSPCRTACCIKPSFSRPITFNVCYHSQKTRGRIILRSFPSPPPFLFPITDICRQKEDPQIGHTNSAWHCSFRWNLPLKYAFYLVDGGKTTSLGFANTAHSQTQNMF